MSYIDRLNEEEDQQNQPTPPPVAPTRGNTFNAGLPASQKGSGRFTDLRKYMSANQGAGAQIGQRANQAAQRGYTSFQKQYGKESQGIQDAFNKGRNVVDTEGTGFKTKLGGFKQGIDQFQGFQDAETADQTAFADTGQAIQNFAKGPQFAQFQNIQAGEAIDEQSLLNKQAQAALMNQKMLENVQSTQGDINTEAGRAKLLGAARPRFGNYDLGNQRLDQMFFQSNPNAINQIQSTLGTQAQALGTEAKAQEGLKTNINKLAADEAELAKALTDTSGEVQDLFEKRLGTQQNIAYADKLRKQLYDEYVAQLGASGGEISSDLANVLFGEQADSMGGKGYKTATSGPQTDQFTAWNTGKPASAYLAYDPTKTFQDLLSDDAYSTYSALGNMSKKGTRFGPSTIGSGTRLVGDYIGDLSKAQSDFMNTYTKDGVGKSVSALGFDPNAYRTNTYTRSGDNFTPLDAYKYYGDKFGGLGSGSTIDQVAKDWQSQSAEGIWSGAGSMNIGDMMPHLSVGEYSTDVDKLINDIAGTTKNYSVGGGWRPSTTDITNNTQSYYQPIKTRLNTDLMNKINPYKEKLLQTGVKNVKTLGTTDARQAAKYRRFKGLL
jgi:hypothetical protein